MFKKIKIFDADNKCVDVIADELHQKCRTCIKNDGVINLFTAKHKDISLNEMFVMFSLPAMNVSDGLPQKICAFCAKVLIEFYSFKLQTEQVQLMLQIAAGKVTLRNLPKLNNVSTKVNGVHSNQNKSSESNKNITQNKFLSPSYTCSDCKLSFKNYAEYVSHRTKVLEKQNQERETFFVDNTEDDIFDSKKDILLDHDYSKLITPNDDAHQKKTNLKSKCIVCGLEFDSTAEYLEHKQEHSRRHRTPCILCNKNILTHKMEQHKLSHAQTKCRMSAMLVDSQTGEFCCSLCDLKFDSRLRYLLHKRCKKSKQLKTENLKRTKPPVKKHPCPICGLHYSASILTDHVNTHTQEEPYMCEICGKKFRFKSNFRSHKHIQALCHFCGAILNSPSGFRRHMKMKHSIGTYTCDKCEKIFHSKNQLDVHFRRHTGI